MKGNQARRGATSKKSQSGAGPKVGSGGRHRKALAGKGPTPKAEDRTWHPAHTKKQERDQQAKQDAARVKAQTKTPVRAAEGNEIIVGRNSVLEAVRAGTQIKRIFIAADPAQGKMQEVYEALANTGAPFVEVTKRDLDRASDGAAHQGVAIEVLGYQYLDLDELIVDAVQKAEPALLVALDHVTDPHNLGAVIRSGAAFGVDGLILPERRAAGIGVTAWKVSAGAAARMAASQVTNLVRALEKCKEAGFFIVGLDGNADTSVRGLELATEPLVLVTGAEGSGLSRLVRQTCDVIVSIPMSGAVESLNASVATGIALYEISQVRDQVKS